MSTFQYVFVYLLSVPVFFAIDMVWLGFVATSFYKSQIGHLLGPVNWPVAIAFYWKSKIPCGLATGYERLTDMERRRRFYIQQKRPIPLREYPALLGRGSTKRTFLFFSLAW